MAGKGEWGRGVVRLRVRVDIEVAFLMAKSFETRRFVEKRCDEV